MNRQVLPDRGAVVGPIVLDHLSLRVTGPAPRQMQVERRGIGHVAGEGKGQLDGRASGAWRWAGSGNCNRGWGRRRLVVARSRRTGHVELERRTCRGAERESADDRSEPRDVHRRPHNAPTAGIGTKRRPVEKWRNLFLPRAVYENSLREERCSSAERRKNLLHRQPTLIELSTTLRGATSQVQKGRHNMQYIDEHGCLTQRSQLDRLRELADGTARQRVKAMAPTELLPTTVFVVNLGGKESIWDLDHLAVAGSSSGSAVQLVLGPELALDNLVPTHAIMRILRDTAASAVAVMAAVNASAAALQLADLDHEQSLTARIEREPEHEPALGQWDFGKVAWTVRLRHVLRAARSATVEEEGAMPIRPPVAPSPPSRPADPVAARKNLRREMREQLHRQPAAGPSWLR